MIWRIQLAVWLVVYGYLPWTSIVDSYRATGTDAWQSYKESGYSPRETILEDLSHG